MAHYEWQGKQIYINDRFIREADRKIIPLLKKKDMDFVFMVDGKERSGKSVCAQTLAGYFASRLGTKFDVSNICMTPTEFKERVMRSQKNEVIIYDEAHRGMGSSSALSEVNKILKDLMMEMGQKNLVVFVVLPTFFLIERYIALFRAYGLFHVYMHKGQRGFWVYFNERHKHVLYDKGKKFYNYLCTKWPPFKGRFLEQYIVDEQEYRAKKGRAFSDSPKTYMETKGEHFMEQRDRLLYFMHKELKMKTENISEYCKQLGLPLSVRHLQRIFKEIRAVLEGRTPKSIGRDLSSINI